MSLYYYTLTLEMYFWNILTVTMILVSCAQVSAFQEHAPPPPPPNMLQVLHFGLSSHHLAMAKSDIMVYTVLIRVHLAYFCAVLQINL